MISILTPSRSRPQLAKRMYDSAKKFASQEIEILFFLNEDDPLLQDYISFLKDGEYLIGPNQSTCYSWNLMAKQAKHDILFLVGDDAQFETLSWDKKILDAFNLYPDKIACIYPKVPTLGKNKCPHFCLHKDWIRVLGYYLPPHFYHWYVDTWIRALAQAVGRFHCLFDFEMPIEAIKDNVSKSYHNSWMRERDDWMWEVTSRHRASDIEALTSYIQSFKK
jgi:hypothetical protein